jgi:glutamate N-acetyltransferase/amino-acid N-acetyltransferase
MAEMVEVIPNGTVTSPKGFLAGATYAGLKTYSPDKLDLGLLVSEKPSIAAGVFTTNKIVSPSVTLSKTHIKSGKAQAIVANSGCANTCVGNQGLKDAHEVVKLAAHHLGMIPEEVLICSTGVIGVELPMALIRKSISNINCTSDGGHQLAQAIMTTDTHPKEIAVSVKVNGKKITIGGIAKGSGMIHPNMATMLSFISTDALLEKNFLNDSLREAVNSSFNMIDVDGDQSTNDSVILLANGIADNEMVEFGTPAAKTFQAALNYVCIGLAKELARDGEGSTKLIEASVEGARNIDDARSIARSVVTSVLVKAAIHGNDPNWGRIMMAVGNCGVEVDESKIALYISDICIVEEGKPIPYFVDAVVAAMAGNDVSLKIQLNLGKGTATAWGSEMTEEYVTFNSAYTT